MSEKDYIYGRHPVMELLQHAPASVLRLMLAVPAPNLQEIARQQNIAVDQVSKRDFELLFGNAIHQGIAAQIKSFQYADIAAILKAPKPRLMVALDQIQDPHNLGAIIRSAHALGACGILYSKDRACDVTATAVKASAGATAHLPIVRVTNLVRSLEQLKENGFWLVGTTVDGGTPLHKIDLKGDIVLVIGSEGEGLRRIVTQACDFLAHIPMAGKIGSLNASVAASICLYEALRQKYLP